MKQYRTIDGNWANECNCVALCCFRKHKGYVTVKQIRTHRCLARQCRMLRKLENHKYWKDRQKRRAEQKIKRKEKYG